MKGLGNTKQEWNKSLDKSSLDPEDFTRNIVNHIEYSLGLSENQVDNVIAYQGTVASIRKRLVQNIKSTEEKMSSTKSLSYMSLEFLLGRALQNAVLNLQIASPLKESLHSLGLSLEDLYETELDAGLGNGGLGRLAACFFDSLATLNLPAIGYGLYYSYGMFKQLIDESGKQIEVPDPWLTQCDGMYPWQIHRHELRYPVKFHGETQKYIVDAVALDYPVPGYKTDNTLVLRLWKGFPHRKSGVGDGIDLNTFNSGKFNDSFEEIVHADSLTAVLYPNDGTTEGKELRLKQEYFFVSATIQDILRRFKISIGKINQRLTFEDITKLKDFHVIQMNDTHPALAPIELIRILLDEELRSSDRFNDIIEEITKCFGYTNHTVLPEALEKWGVDTITRILGERIMEIIYKINHIILEEKVAKKWPGEVEKLKDISVIEEGNNNDEKKVRMANLSIILSNKVNGVAELHTSLLKTGMFKNFVDIWENKFTNKTNGVTLRRWMLLCNPNMCKLIEEIVEDKENWVMKPENELIKLVKLSDNEEFQKKWENVKKNNKKKLIEYITNVCGVDGITEDYLFDVQIKRIHEYKRQLMNIMSVIYKYKLLKSNPELIDKQVKKVYIFAGKAASSYVTAKGIIHLIGKVSKVVNNDPALKGVIKVVFIPNYSVSLAELIVPATDISQQISTAGMEASGTGNMKFALNGSLIIGTLDGANVEISRAIGMQNIFIFGAKADQVDGLRYKAEQSNEFREAVYLVRQGLFGDSGEVEGVMKSIESKEKDYYLLGADFNDYLKAINDVEEAWKDRKRWLKMSIESTAKSGMFSSDRTIREYTEEIWGLTPLK